MPQQTGCRRTSLVEAHTIFDKYHQHELNEEKEEGAAEASKQDKSTLKAELFAQFHRVEKTGVIYATSRAASHGFSAENEEWANMVRMAEELQNNTFCFIFAFISILYIYHLLLLIFTI